MKIYLPLLLASAAAVFSGCGSVEDISPADKGTPAAAATETTAVTAAVSETAERTTAAPAELPDTVKTAYEKPSPADKKAELMDISLAASERELTADEPADLIWSAEIPADCSPAIVYLIDEDTFETAAELNDIADFEKYGGDIMGDSVYNCRFTPDTHIDTDPDVSETKKYHYFAMFTDENGTHRSDTFELAVYEPFTDKELDDMEAVRNAIKELLESDEYKALDNDAKYERAGQLLAELAENGTPDRPYPLIQAESIIADPKYDCVSYRYLSGVNAGIHIKPLSRDMK